VNEEDLDEALEQLNDGVEKLRLVGEKLRVVPRKSVEFYEIISKLTQITPEPGFELLNNAAIGIHLVGPEGTILWANTCELKSLGHDPGEYLGKNIGEFHLDADVIEHILKTLTGGGKLRAYPARLKTVDGGTSYVLINSSTYGVGEKFTHTRCFTMTVSKEVYDARRCCDLPTCPHIEGPDRSLGTERPGASF